MLDDRENIQNILLEEGGAILVLEVVLPQEYLNARLDAEGPHEGDLLQVKVLDRCVERLGRRALPVEVGLEVGLDLLPQRLGRQRGPLDLGLLGAVVAALALVASLGRFALQLLEILLGMDQLGRRQEAVEEVTYGGGQAHQFGALEFEFDFAGIREKLAIIVPYRVF